MAIGKGINTVKDLIEELKKYNDNTTVLCGYRDNKGLNTFDSVIEYHKEPNLYDDNDDYVFIGFELIEF